MSSSPALAPAQAGGFRPTRAGAAPRPAATAAQTAPRLLMVLAVYALPVLVAVRAVADPVFDPDIWWHLRVGQWVVEHGSVPGHDPFSLPGHDRPWVAYSWLFEVVVYGL